MKFTSFGQKEMISIQISRETLARLLSQQQLVLEDVRANSLDGRLALRSLLLEAASRRLAD